MIDIHCHLLPTLDDGSSNMEETKKMLSMAIEEGIDGIFATSHFEYGMDAKWKHTYQKRFEEVQRYIENNNLPITLYEGSEIFYSDGIHSSLEETKLYTMNQTPYVLVEFPLYASFSFIERAVSNLIYGGYWPILAHVERYSALKDIQCVRELVKKGACIQVNASSIAGNRGWMLKYYCLHLMKNHLLHFVATDAHGSDNRPPRVREAIAYMEKKMGKYYTRKIIERNPQRIMEGERIGGEN